MRPPTQRVAGLTCARSTRRCETLPSAVALFRNSGHASRVQHQKDGATLQRRVLRTASEAYLKSGIARSPLQWSHIVHRVRDPSWKPVVSTGMAGEQQVRGHGGHGHHHHRKDKEQNTRSEEGATAIRPTRTPASATSGGVLPTSPGASSHGLASHSHSTNYYYSPTTPPPQFLLYPSNMVPQPAGQVPAGTGSDSAPGMQPQMQPVPVYMVAAPQFVMPTSSPPPSGRRHHRSNHHSDMPRPHHSGKSPRNPP